MKVNAVVALIVFLLLPGISYALTDKQKALVGLKGVLVVVEDIRPQAEPLDLTIDQIQTDVELRLRKAGLRVLTVLEMLETPGRPYLYVNVNPIIWSGICACAIEVNLRETVMLARGLKTQGSIWDERSAGFVRKENIRQIRDRISDEVDKFINDYLAANPK